MVEEYCRLPLSNAVGFPQSMAIIKKNVVKFCLELEVIIEYECVHVKVSFFSIHPSCLSVLKSW